MFFRAWSDTFETWRDRPQLGRPPSLIGDMSIMLRLWLADKVWSRRGAAQCGAYQRLWYASCWSLESHQHRIAGLSFGFANVRLNRVCNRPWRVSRLRALALWTRIWSSKLSASMGAWIQATCARPCTIRPLKRRAPSSSMFKIASFIL